MADQIFIKKFQNEEAARKEYERAVVIHEKIKGCQYVFTPRPLSLTGGDICYEAIIEKESLFRLVNSVFLREGFADIFYALGRALAEFHKAINSGQDLEKEEINLHGDFSVKNIILSGRERRIFFIDFSPMKQAGSAPQGSLYDDLAHFLADIVYRYPLYVFLLRYRRLNKKLAADFLKGYSEFSGIGIDEKKLAGGMINCLNKRKEVFRHKNPISGWLWNLILNRDIDKESKKLKEDYSYSHRYWEVGRKYDCESFAEGSAESYIWRREKAILADILKDRRFNRYLDFACGTGRLLLELDKYASEAIGTDISESMLNRARGKNPRARLILGDVLTKNSLVDGRFDLITAFRFFLNAQEELRQKAFGFIHDRLSPDGLFIFNNHGNKSSLRRLVKTRKMFYGNYIFNELSHDEVLKLIGEHGFRLVGFYPANFFLKAIIRLLPEKTTDFFNNALAQSRFWRRHGIEVIYVCQKGI